MAQLIFLLSFYLQCFREWEGFLQKGTINLPGEWFLLPCIKAALSLLAEIQRPLSDDVKASILSFYSMIQSILLFMFLKGQNFRSRRVLEEKSDKTGRANRLIYLCILAPWDYLWSFQHHITNPKKQLYNKKYFLGLGLLHNIIHIWCGRDYTARQ